MILQQKKVRFDNYVNTRKNPYSSSGIYLATAKVAQYRLVADNSREKEEKNETANNTAAWKLCIQQKWSQAFKKYQDSMKSISSYPTK